MYVNNNFGDWHKVSFLTRCSFCVVGALYVNDNQLTGTIPIEFQDLWLTDLYIQNNQFTGTIPEEVCRALYLIEITPGNEGLEPCNETGSLWDDDDDWLFWDDDDDDDDDNIFSR